MLASVPLCAQNLLVPGTPVFDRPTLTVLGIQFPVTGDDNYNATVAVQYRLTGSTQWFPALPLFRVHPETVADYTVQPQFAGSIYDLRPNTSYDVQLHAVDPDGLDETWILTGSTRPVPSDPPVPNTVNVSTASELISALQNAQPGDVILLANGTYNGQFQILNGGTANNPIVVRGQSQNGVILDGGNCGSCNIFEVYGPGYVHLENMTLQNANRAVRFQSENCYGNVARYLHIVNTQLGIGAQPNQYDSYIADNILEGTLLWPHVYSDDNGEYANYDGIAVYGFGHVIAYNQISGYGDAMKTIQDGARSIDFYGNEILYTYDNGVELDGSEGNTRAFRNRFTNTFSPLSVQPIHGGPAYLLRNVVVNIVSEQMKFHPQEEPDGTSEEPSGILSYNNTFLASQIPELNLQTPATSHYFAVENNIFLAPASTRGPEAVDWTGVIDHGVFDYDGYFPDGIFRFNNPALGGYFLAQDFAALQVLGMEPHGLLASGNLFASGVQPPPDYTTQLPPQDVTLAAGAVVIDKGLVLPNINDQYIGAGPDLGALELGCPNPTYGPRPVGVDESNEVVGCTANLGVAVTPASVTLKPFANQRFTAATVPTGGSVTWSISPALGSITSAGVYSAPTSALLGETVTVKATSTTNSNASGTAVVYLTAPVLVGINPRFASVSPNGTSQFTAAVTGAVNTGVNWSLSPNVGSISSSGLYTAPASYTPQTISVIATSQADSTASASAKLTLLSTSPPVTVTVSPSSATVHRGGTQQFQAAVANASNTGVTWKISPQIGTISSTGLYTATSQLPLTVNLTVTATSADSPSVSGTAIIFLQP